MRQHVFALSRALKPVRVCNAQLPMTSAAKLYYAQLLLLRERFHGNVVISWYSSRRFLFRGNALDASCASLPSSLSSAPKQTVCDRARVTLCWFGSSFVRDVRLDCAPPLFPTLVRVFSGDTARFRVALGAISALVVG